MRVRKIGRPTMIITLKKNTLMFKKVVGAPVELVDVSSYIILRAEV